MTRRRDILTTLLPGFTGPVAPSWLVERLREGLGGVCLFGSNVVDADQVRELTSTLRTANPDAVVAVDEEGGDVTRLHAAEGSPWPGNAVLGRLDDVELTEAVGREVGEALRAVGVTLTFAPDADVNSDPRNPVIGVRSFGTDPTLAARHTAAWTRGVQSAGVAACAKHFPGHGDTAVDSHLALPVVDVPLDVLRERELAPFRAAIEAGTLALMTSHILLPHLDAEHPATLSPRILHRLLRGELGYRGVVVSDALDMHGASGEHGIPEAAVLALVAGCDLLCIGTDVTPATLDAIVDAVEAAIDSGRLRIERVREAAARVRALAEAPGSSGSSGASRPSDSSGTPETPAGSLMLPLDRVAAAFEVAPGALERWADVDAGQQGRVGTVVRVETAANIAVGDVPWGPFAAERAAPGSWLGEASVVVLEPDAPLDAPSALPGPVVVVGKDLHRHAFAIDAIDALRAARDDVLVVDAGWPSHDERRWDLATFGASRLVGAALIAVVGAAIAAPPSQQAQAGSG